MTEFPFSEDAVLEAARAATGLSDFGGDGFREGLRVLLETYEGAAGLSERGRKHNWRRVVLLLSTRLRVAKTLREHPEIRERELRRPVYLTGLPRTGTSALFNLLASDPAARPLLAWEGIFPDPLELEDPLCPRFFNSFIILSWSIIVRSSLEAAPARECDRCFEEPA